MAVCGREERCRRALPCGAAAAVGGCRLYQLVTVMQRSCNGHVTVMLLKDTFPVPQAMQRYCNGNVTVM